MLKHPKGPLPRIQPLRAFEAAARHSSFVRAAEELGIHQPTVSRHVAELEQEIGVRLFERDHRSVRLTLAGEVYQRAVATGLEQIAAGGLTALNLAEDKRVVIACAPALSHLILIHRFQHLRLAIGQDVCLRILTLDPDRIGLLDDSDVDLTLTYHDNASAPEGGMPVFGEAITPVCSPDFAAAHADVLARPVEEWGAMPFLRLARPALGWATWHDWFDSAGYPAPPPRYIGIEDYAFLLASAVAGEGLALGWRHFIERHLDEGRLVTVVDGFVEGNRSCFARLTERGRKRPEAHRCFDAVCALMLKEAARA